VATTALPLAEPGRLAQLRARAARTWTRSLRPALRPAVPVLKNLASIPLTTAAAVCCSIGAFIAYPVAGWFTTAACLVVLEHLIADEG
jgi:hypothetical protein